MDGRAFSVKAGDVISAGTRRNRVNASDKKLRCSGFRNQPPGSSDDVEVK